MSVPSSECFSVERMTEPAQSAVSIVLAQEHLWQEFHQYTNEMIVTKAGRKMFPKFALDVKGLDPHAYYGFILTMKLVGNDRYKFTAGEWQTAGQSDTRESSNPVNHHDQAQKGEFWMRNTVSFERVKLTNRPKSEGGSEVALHSMHKYQPVVQLIRYQRDGEPRLEAVFEPECAQFIAVTAYQNQFVIEMKVKHNPFAKGFRDGSARKRKQSDSPSEMYGFMKKAQFDLLANNNLALTYPFTAPNCSAFSAFGVPTSPNGYPSMTPMAQAVPTTPTPAHQQVSPQMLPYHLYWPMFNPAPMAVPIKDESQY